MGLTDLFKSNDSISPKHAERLAAVASMRETLAARKQDLASKHARELENITAAEGKKIADLEAAHRAFVLRHEETIAEEALASLRSAASTRRDQPGAAAASIQKAWLAFSDRVAIELGNDTPNYLLLLLALAPDGHGDKIGAGWLFRTTSVAGALVSAIGALHGESPIAAAEALRHLDLTLDVAIRSRSDDANPERTEALAKCARLTTAHAACDRLSTANPLLRSRGIGYDNAIGVLIHDLRARAARLKVAPEPKALAFEPPTQVRRRNTENADGVTYSETAPPAPAPQHADPGGVFLDAAGR